MILYVCKRIKKQLNAKWDLLKWCRLLIEFSIFIIPNAPPPIGKASDFISVVDEGDASEISACGVSKIDYYYPRHDH